MNNTYLYIVDDEDSIRNALERGLRRWARDTGMTIQTFGTPKEILEALRMNAGSVRIIISDLRMPHMDGLALLKTINEEHPTIPGILLTGNIDIDSIVSTNPPGVFSIVEKPWEHEALIKILEKAIQHRAERT